MASVASALTRVLVAGFVVVCAAGGTPRIIAAESDCAGPDAQAAAHRLETARGAYEDVLASAPEAQCAMDGLVQVGAKRLEATSAFEQGRTLESQGKRDEARQQYIVAVTVDSEFAEALEALTRLDSPDSKAGDLWASVRGLHDAGFTEEAATKAKEVIAAHPDSTLPPDLYGLPSRSSSVSTWIAAQGWLANLGSIVGAFTSFAATLVPFLAAFAVLSLVVPWSRRKILRLLRRDRDVLDIGDIDDTAVDAKVGKAISAIILGELLELKRDGTVFRFDLARGPSTAVTDLPEAVLSAVPHFELLAGLATMLRPAKWSLTGTLLPPDGSRGPGLELMLQGAGNTISRVTLWGRDYDGHGGVEASDKPTIADVNRSIALAAAAWLAYEIREPRADRATPYPLPTPMWRSYALFRSGVAWQEDRQKGRAHALFLDSLSIDPDNWLALFGLGGVHPVDAERNLYYERCLTTLDAALPGVPDAPPGSRPHNLREPVFYKATYNLVARGYNQLASAGELIRQPGGTAGTVPSAADMAARRAFDARLTQVSIAAASTLASGPSVELAEFLRPFVDVAVIALAAIRLPFPRSPGRIPPLDRSQPGALAAKLAAASSEQLVTWLGANPEKNLLRPMVLYNLASYRRGSGDDALAIEALRGAFLSPPLREFAKQDKSLGWLKKRYPKVWTELLGPSNEEPPWLVRMWGRLIGADAADPSAAAGN